MITELPYFRALRPAVVRLSGQIRTPPGRLGGDLDSGAPARQLPPPRPHARPGRAPRRGLNLSRKHRPLPPQADRRTARFFTSFPGAGRRGDLPQALDRAFFFGSRNRFCLGPSKKKWVRETYDLRTAFLADHFFFREKRNGPHHKEKSQSGVGQNTSISGAEQYCYYWEAPLPGVTPCARAAFGAGQHPSGAPAFCAP